MKLQANALPSCFVTAPKPEWVRPVSFNFSQDIKPGNTNNYFMAHDSRKPGRQIFALSLFKTFVTLSIRIPFFLTFRRVKETFVV